MLRSYSISSVAIGYVLFDTADKWKKSLEDAEARLPADIPGADRGRLVTAIGTFHSAMLLDQPSTCLSLPFLLAVLDMIGLERGLDTIIWQLLASVAIPGSTIHAIVALTSGLIKRTLEEKSDVVQSLATSTNLGTDVVMECLNKSLPTCVGLVRRILLHPVSAPSASLQTSHSIALQILFSLQSHSSVRICRRSRALTLFSLTNCPCFTVHPIDNGVHALLNYTTRPLLRSYVCNNGTNRIALPQLACTS